MPKKKTADQIAAECDRRLRAGLKGELAAAPHGQCDPDCCNSLVDILEQERELLLDALAQNIAAEVACVNCCQPPPDQG